MFSNFHFIVEKLLLSSVNHCNVVPNNLCLIRIDVHVSAEEESYQIKLEQTNGARMNLNNLNELLHSIAPTHEIHPSIELIYFNSQGLFFLWILNFRFFSKNVFLLPDSIDLIRLNETVFFEHCEKCFFNSNNLNNSSILEKIQKKKKLAQIRIFLIIFSVYRGGNRL